MSLPRPFFCVTYVFLLLTFCSAQSILNRSPSAIGVEFITNDNGALVSQAFAFNSSPCPAIFADVTNVTIDAEGVATVTVSGAVDDPVSDVVSDPLLQVQSLSFSVEGQNPTTTQLVNTASPELPWRPYAFEAPFTISTLVEVRPASFGPPAAVGATRLQLQTSPNAAGCSGLAFVNLSVEDATIIAHAGRSGPGTFKPTMLRLVLPSASPPPSDTTILAFGRLWNVQQFNFGDGPHWYAVDGNVNPVVFVPAAGAPPSDNVQQLPGDFVADVFVGSFKVGEGKKPTEHGLLVWQDDVTNLLNMHLKNYKSKTYKEQRNGQKQNVYVYEADNGFDHVGNELVDEILWREVRQAVRASVFNSGTELNTDITYRQGVVSSTGDVGFGFGSLTVNKDFWTRFYRVKDKGADTSACNAIADMFDTTCDGGRIPGNSSRYSMGCYQAAQFLVMRGASIALKKARIDSILGTYLDVTWEALEGARDVGEDSTAEWLPGDWGYIANTDPAVSPNLKNEEEKKAAFEFQRQNPQWRLLQGENIFYLGGSFDTDPKKFSANALFWGHINRTPKRTLDRWIAAVNDFPTPKRNAVLRSSRESLRLPPTPTRLQTDTTMTPNEFAGGTIAIDQNAYEVLSNTEKDVYIFTAPLVHFGVKPKMGGATLTGNMYAYYKSVGLLNMKVTDIQMRQSEFEDGTLTIAAKDYPVLTNTTTQAGAASIFLKKDSTLTIPFSLSKGSNKKNGNVLFVDFAP